MHEKVNQAYEMALREKKFIEEGGICRADFNDPGIVKEVLHPVVVSMCCSMQKA
jgi:hypothetical protein